jgi:hypothetical protein
MPQQVIRLYDVAANGAKAAQALADEGFGDVFHFKSSGAKGAAAAKARTELVNEMAAAQIYKSHAESYADHLAKGGALVLVHAPFGSGVNAARIMDSHGSTAQGLNHAAPAQDFVWDPSTPLSCALQLPVLTKVHHPFETLTGVSSLSKGKAFISNLLGIPLLSRGLEHRESSFGLPLLSRSATPLSSMLGMKTLSSNPTPLSSMFGLGVLRGR